MRSHVRTWRLPLRMLALVLIVTALPMPCLADEPGQPATRPRLLASVTPIVKELAAKPAPAAARAQEAAPGKEQLGSVSFFRKPAGIATLVIVGLGAAYAIRSARVDRIHSPAAGK